MPSPDTGNLDPIYNYCKKAFASIYNSKVHGFCRYPVFGLQGLAGEVEGGCGASKGRLNKSSSGTLGYTKGSPDEHDNIDTKEAGCTFSVAPDTSLKGFNRSKNKSTVTEQIPRESLVAGSGAIILHPGMGTGDDLTAMALVPLRQKITQALDIGKRRIHSVEKLGTGR